MTTSLKRVGETAIKFKRAIEALEAWDGGDDSWRELQARRDVTYVQLMEAVEVLEMMEAEQARLFE